MRLALFALALVLAAGCGDGADPVTVADASAVADAPAADDTGTLSSTPSAPTDETCRTVVGPKLTNEPMRLIPEQTFAATLPGQGDGCFLTAYDPVSMEDSERSVVSGTTEDPPYPYSYTLTDATGSATTLLEPQAGSEPDHHLRLIAVGFPDLNADGAADVVLVHDACRPALAWTAFADGWVQMPSTDGAAGIPACTVAEATAAFREQAARPVSP